MLEQGINRELSQLSTCWSVVRRAHSGPEEERAAARADLLTRYGGAVSRYVHGALRDPEEAEEVCQEFALRFLRGDFHRANPNAGRFRDFIKTALIRLVSRHVGYRRAAPCSLATDVADRVPTPEEQAEQEFLQSWRAELLSRAWQALQRLREKKRSPFYDVLRLRVDHDDLSMEDLAKQLSARLSRAVKPDTFRQILYRARQRFARFLLVEVAESLATPSAEAIEAELADLHLLKYCRSALARQD
jgi:RNA polymerase sigma-70 factor (ECF subfamily)